MSQAKGINVPIAQSCGNTATLTLPNHLNGAEYAPKEGTHCPLVCGEEAFGAVYDAIAGAQHTVELLCWGFQPSMYFRRGAAGQGSMPIGQLLLERASKHNVKVRLLVWGDKAHIAQFLENMMPGGRLSFADDNRNSTQREFDAWWYAQVKLDKKNKPGTDVTIWDLVPNPFGLNENLTRPLLRKGQDPGFANIEFATRDFDFDERAEIAWRTAFDTAYAERTKAARLKNGVAMGGAPSHHQKMVLVDYEHPEKATGFVMGHNTLDEYWDNNSHSRVRMHPQMGRNGFHPRQDISARVTGPVLIDLNKNFCEAWDDATGQQLGKQRESVKKPLLRCGTEDLPVMAQILRTQPQKGKRGVKDIEKLYLQAIRNTSNFIYIENQYFRFPPLATALRELVKAYQEGGRKTPLYLFVVTNSTDEGIGLGTVSTYHMLNALGRADVLPGVAKLERTEVLGAQYEAAVAAKKTADQVLSNAIRTPVAPFSSSMQYVMNNLVASRQEAAAAAERVEELKAQLEKAQTENPKMLEIAGLKVHICTLVPFDTPKGMAWDEVYIHTKLMIIDDYFVTHGSANINLRSMEGDSELNIAHESSRVTQALREKLWRIHTNGLGVGEKDGNGRLDAEKVFDRWKIICNENKNRKARKNWRPYASLIEFYRDDPTRSDWD